MPNQHYVSTATCVKCRERKRREEMAQTPAADINPNPSDKTSPQESPKSQNPTRHQHDTRQDRGSLIEKLDPGSYEHFKTKMTRPQQQPRREELQYSNVSQ
ncbi:hypothetical protein NL108_008248 [Boleophthalmus pectinirostris]|nr:hypothetical protein NL108_008248 [Boleophthalmus pectinirostris]